MRQYRYIFEILLAYLIGHAINYFFFPNKLGFIGMSPHPYWLLILLASMKYGFYAGFLAGGIGAALYLLSAHFLAPTYFFEDQFNYVLPVSFVVLGSLMGFGIDSYKKEGLVLKQKHDELFANEQIYLKRIAALEEIKQGMERKVATQMNTLITLYEGARKMERDNLPELYQGILEFMQKSLDSSEIALYLKVEQGWKLEKQIGWKDYHQRPEWIALDQGIVGMVGKSGKIISVRDFVKPDSPLVMPTLIGDCLFAGPLRKSEKGEVIGVIAIGQLPLQKFNSATLNLFLFLLGWAARSLQRYQYIHNLQENSILDLRYQVNAKQYLLTRLAQEFSRSKKYYLPLSLTLIGLVKRDLASESMQAIKIMLVESIKRSVRDMDVVSLWDEAPYDFAILWITLGEAQVKINMEMIQTHFQSLWEESKDANDYAIHFKLASFNPRLAAPEDLLKLVVNVAA